MAIAELIANTLVGLYLGSMALFCGYLAWVMIAREVRYEWSWCRWSRTEQERRRTVREIQAMRERVRERRV